MNRRILTLLAGGTAAAFALALPLSAAPKNTNHNTNLPPNTKNCGGDNNITIVAPEELWPPNHKYFTGISVTADDGEDNKTVTLETTGTHNQPDGDTGGNGSGNTADDITTDGEDPTIVTSDDGQTVVAEEKSDTGTVTTNWKARAERAGTLKPGRTYTLSAIATFADGDSTGDNNPNCTHSVTFTVPHDMRKSTRTP